MRSAMLLLLAFLASTSPALAQTVERCGVSEGETRVSLREVRRYGERSAGALDVVLSIQPDHRGGLYVTTSQVLLHFSGPDAEARQVGRRGRGRDHYMLPVGLSLDETGTLWLQDVALQRVMGFAGDSVVDVIRMGPGLSTATRPMVAGEDGRFFIPVGLGAAPGGTRRHGWVSVDRRSEVRDTIHAPPEDRVGMNHTVLTPAGAQQPFPVRTLHALSPDGRLAVVRNDTYEISVMTPGVGNAAVVRRHARPVTVSHAEREYWLEVHAKAVEAFPERFEGTFFEPPEEKPLIEELAFDSDGRLWAQRHGPGEPFTRANGHVLFQEPQVWDVFATDGSFLFSVHLPGDSALGYAAGCRIWVVRTSSASRTIQELALEGR